MSISLGISRVMVMKAPEMGMFLDGLVGIRGDRAWFGGLHVQGEVGAPEGGSR